ncbi:MAG TPA: hypothetical protein VHQ48_16955 [Bradyrhizobium sp.]|jgi:hypothetical protein|nr:hypothetical protein [Bradyrhizobium sp.]
MYAVADSGDGSATAPSLLQVFFASLAEQGAQHPMDSDESEKSRRHFASSVEKFGV